MLSSDATGDELGPPLLLPDGRVLYLGANGNTAFYTPSTNSWTAGPVIPDGFASADAPAAMLPNGHVLLAVSPEIADGQFNGPTKVVEFDPVAGSTTDVTPTNFDMTSHSFVNVMLVLPTGQVLMVNDSRQLDVYTPAGSPDESWRPTITGASFSAAI